MTGNEFIMFIPHHYIGGRSHNVERKATYPVGFILPRIGRHKKHLGAKMNLDGDMVLCNSLKLKMFRTSGCKCKHCGMKGAFFAKEYDLSNVANRKTIEYHLRLYGMNENGEVLMTIDHIIPKSKGGEDCLSNMQTLCFICNNKKTDKMPVFKSPFRLWMEKKYNKAHRRFTGFKQTVFQFKNKIKNKIQKKYNHFIYTHKIGIKVEDDGRFTKKHDWFWH